MAHAAAQDVRGRGEFDDFEKSRKLNGGAWPSAAYGIGKQVMRVEVSLWPVRTPTPHLADFLKYPTKPSSKRATAGFLERTTRSQLRFSEGFVEAVASYLEQMRDTTLVAASRLKKSKKRPAKA